MTTIPDRDDGRQDASLALRPVNDRAARLGDDLAGQLLRHTWRTGDHGEPVIDADRAADAVEMLRVGREVLHG